MIATNRRPHPVGTTYATRGWLHDAGPAVQRQVHDSFLETMAWLHRVPVGEASWLGGPQASASVPS